MFNDPNVKSKAKQGRKLPPGRKRVAYTKMFMGLLYLGLFVVFGATHNFSAALEPSFTEKSILVRCADLGYYISWLSCLTRFHVRIGLFQVYGFFERSKYYAIWTLTEVRHILDHDVCLTLWTGSQYHYWAWLHGFRFVRPNPLGGRSERESS